MPVKKVLNEVDLSKVRDWLERTGKKILVYHRDADGVCSAAILMKFFPEFASIPREGPIIDKKFFRRIVSEKPEVLVFLDMPIDQEWEKVRDFAKELPGLSILIIDHHMPEKDMNSERIIHINPRFLKSEYYIPASCVIYELLRRLGYSVKPYCWISLTGIIGDYGTKDCEWMFRECLEDLGILHCKLVRASEIISSAITLKGLKGCEKALELLLKSERYEDFEKSRELKKWNEIVQKEVRRIVNDFEKRKEVFEKERLILYEIKSRMNITSVTGTVTAEKHPEDIVIIRKKSGNLWKISLRYQSGKLNVGDLAKHASKGIGSGGGHIKSAGALVNNWEEFRKRVFEYLK
ncbi:MAG: DHH family phosphoesterase [Candidatus Aenigmatarchaeota archaeon]|nr:MAG: DHH family phosphoesterase [Candidatus Aenigmarchaeota archaeon]